jgi:selenocysteine-specific elongation factor
VRKIFCFDATVAFKSPVATESARAWLEMGGEAALASFRFFQKKSVRAGESAFVRVHSSRPLSAEWKVSFTLKKSKGGEVWGEGVVLDPLPEEEGPSRIKRRMRFLRQLRGDEKEMLTALAEYKGTKGVWEKEILHFSPLSHKSLLQSSLELEAEGQVRIIGFSPVFLISQTGFIFLCEKILDYLARYHEDHPERIGVPRSKIRSRFNLHPRILSLTLRHLVQDGQITERGNLVALSRFRITLLPEEKRIMMRLEDMILKGEFQSASFEELQKSLRLSAARLQKIMLILVERKKIVLGKDGFILHSRWLEEIVARIRKSRKRELTVSEFKEMTGLSRKYAIPVLELLDQMGITRRRGPVHEIL